MVLAEKTENVIFLVENFIAECKKTGVGVNVKEDSNYSFWVKFNYRNQNFNIGKYLSVKMFNIWGLQLMFLIWRR